MWKISGVDIDLSTSARKKKQQRHINHGELQRTFQVQMQQRAWHLQIKIFVSRHFSHDAAIFTQSEPKLKIFCVLFFVKDSFWLKFSETLFNFNKLSA